jgi:predicted permease
MRAAELVARGWPSDAARAEALRRFGDVPRWSEAMEQMDHERVRRVRLGERAAAVWQDVRYTLRGLARQPAFTAGVVATMALGIGANATMFGIVDRILLRPPAHVRDADGIRRLYFVQTTESGEVVPGATVGYAQFAALRDGVDAFEQLAGYTSRELVLGSGPTAREIDVGIASANLFPMLGVRAALGRFFTAEEDRVPVGDAVVVLGHEFWEREYGGDPGVLGRTVRIRNRDFQVIGVAPPDFTGIDLERIDAWIPITVYGHDHISRFVRAGEWYTTRNVSWMQTVGRLARGVDDARANAGLSLFYRRWFAEPAQDGRRAAPSAEEIARTNPHVVVGPIQQERGPERSDEARVATWLAGVAGIVLLIACANVANLLLARAMRRRREIAVRLALGVGRGRLAAQLVAESTALALLGGAAGVLVASWGGDLVRSVLLPDIAWGSTLADGRVLAFTAVAAALTGVLAGLAPALQASRPDLAAALKAGSREGGGQRSRTRSLLLVAQAALSVVLLAGAGLFVRSLGAVTSTDLGYDPEGVLFTEPSYEAVGYTAVEALEISERVYERLQGLPGVASASRSNSLPFYSMSSIDISVPGVDSIPRLPGAEYPLLNAVTSEYFATIGTRIVRGRAFSESDGPGAPRVIVVNETMARLLWPGAEPLGKCVRLGADSIPCSTVIGVAQETRWRAIRPEPIMQYYIPIEQRQTEERVNILLVRPTGDADAMAATLRGIVLEEAPKLSFVQILPVSDLIEPQVRPWRLGASLFSAFGILALVIAAVGLYSVLAYVVAQRRHEIGVRIALGARTGDVLRMVIAEGVRVVAIGVAIGLVVALLAARALEGLLYGVSPHDPAVVAGVAVVLLLVAVAASLAPAWRASRVDPSTALRAD